MHRLITFSLHWDLRTRGTRRRALALIPAFLSIALCGAAELPDTRTIILVRHAEKASTDADTKLSEKGLARAQTLAGTLRDVKLAKIYISQFLRTRDTAGPIAKQKSIVPEVASTEHLDVLAEKLRQTAPGTASLVVHHSDTVPKLVERLGGGTIPAILEGEYDRFVILTLLPQSKAQILTLRYGGK